MIVMKFGGTSLAGAAQIRQVGGIVKRFARSRPVVVVSAMAGVTDELIASPSARSPGCRARSAAGSIGCREGTAARRASWV